MAKIPDIIPPYASKDVIKKLNYDSDNYKVYMHLSSGNSLTVSQARSNAFNLTQDLTSRINDLTHKFGVEISSMRVKRNGKFMSYKVYWMSGTNQELDKQLEDSLLSCKDGDYEY